MTGNRCKGRRINLQENFGADKDSFKELWREVLPEVLAQVMTDAIGAEKGERSPGRLGYGKVGEKPRGKRSTLLSHHDPPWSLLRAFKG